MNKKICVFFVIALLFPITCFAEMKMDDDAKIKYTIGENVWESDIVNSGTCEYPVPRVASSVLSTIKLNETDKKIVSSLLKKISIILFGFLMGNVFIFIFYEAYPFVRVVLMKKEYNFQQAKKMALCNSIIVGVILFFWNLYLWSLVFSIIYYLINRRLWVKKELRYFDVEEERREREKNKKNKEILEKSTVSKEKDGETGNEKTTNMDGSISNKGSAWEQYLKTLKDNIPSSAKGKGINFVAKEHLKNEPAEEKKKDNNELPTKTQKTNHNFDQKYSDLKKLKELLDEEIITEEEFAKEKSKILK